MRKFVILTALAIGSAALIGCTTTQTSVNPATGQTNVVTTTKGIDPATAAQIDAALSNIMANAPEAIADAQAISALVHGTNK